MMDEPTYTTGKSLSTVVIEAVAEEMDTEPEELPVPLYEAIEPDALDALFGSQNSSDGVVMFSYCDYEVTVTADGGVSLED